VIKAGDTRRERGSSGDVRIDRDDRRQKNQANDRYESRRGPRYDRGERFTLPAIKCRGPRC
jgi:hypothetical protein